MKKYWNLFWHFRKIHLMREFEYRANFFFWTLIALLWTTFNFFFANVIATVNNGIAGWSPTEIILLLSVYSIVDAFVWSIFYGNMSNYTRKVFSGELNNLLVKPINTQFILMTELNDLNNVPRIVIGLIVMYMSINKLGLQPTSLQVFLFIVALISTLVIIYFTWFMLSTLSFYVEKLDNINELFPTVRRFLEMPSDVFKNLPLPMLFATLPFALLTSIPTRILLGTVGYEAVVVFVCVAILSVISSKLLFQYSVRKYSGIAN